MAANLLHLCKSGALAPRAGAHRRDPPAPDHDIEWRSEAIPTGAQQAEYSEGPHRPAHRPAGRAREAFLAAEQRAPLPPSIQALGRHLDLPAPSSTPGNSEPNYTAIGEEP